MAGQRYVCCIDINSLCVFDSDQSAENFSFSINPHFSKLLDALSCDYIQSHSQPAEIDLVIFGDAASYDAAEQCFYLDERRIEFIDIELALHFVTTHHRAQYDIDNDNKNQSHTYFTDPIFIGIPDSLNNLPIILGVALFKNILLMTPSEALLEQCNAKGCFTVKTQQAGDLNISDATLCKQFIEQNHKDILICLDQQNIGDHFCYVELLYFLDKLQAELMPYQLIYSALSSTEITSQKREQQNSKTLLQFFESAIAALSSEKYTPSNYLTLRCCQLGLMSLDELSSDTKPVIYITSAQKAETLSINYESDTFRILRLYEKGEFATNALSHIVTTWLGLGVDESSAVTFVSVSSQAISQSQASLVALPEDEFDCCDNLDQQQPTTETFSHKVAHGTSKLFHNASDTFTGIAKQSSGWLKIKSGQ